MHSTNSAFWHHLSLDKQRAFYQILFKCEKADSTWFFSRNASFFGGSCYVHYTRLNILLHNRKFICARSFSFFGFSYQQQQLLLNHFSLNLLCYSFLFFCLSVFQNHRLGCDSVLQKHFLFQTLLSSTILQSNAKHFHSALQQLCGLKFHQLLCLLWQLKN